MDSASFVDVRNVSFEYSQPRRLFQRALPTHTTLRDISFALNIGDHVTLYGGPGSGKTTLLRLLTGVLKPTRGTITVNSVSPADALARRSLGVGGAGYVSAEESEPAAPPAGGTAYDVLHGFGKTHGIANLPSRIGAIAEAAELTSHLAQRSSTLSTSQRLRLNLARAALSDAPLILLDDVSEQLGVKTLKRLLPRLFEHRTVIIATRFAGTAEALDLPVLLLHRGTIASAGTRDEIAKHTKAPRVMDVWLEGVRYDLFRTLKKHPGIMEVRLLPDGRFHGQRLRITLKSGHYLPSLYDLISQVPLIRVEELPVSLTDILDQL